jgi:hypothetical protein
MASRPECASAGILLALMLTAGGCSHVGGMHWPWHHKPPPPPAPVHELDVTGAAADTYPQYWKRNTLLVDLSAASGTGVITLKPVEGTSWPVRVALRVTPGAVGVVEVRAAQRVRLPISASAGKPVDLELAPGVYTPQSPDMQVSWGPSVAIP